MARRAWSIFSSHGLTLLELSRQPDLRIRDVAEALGVSERSAQSLINDLVDEGYVVRVREGRRNRYAVQTDRPIDAAEPSSPRVAVVLDAVTVSPGP
jgi:DNA-binding MarR family transcriptional regulator